jgi:hypothetical protein
MLKNIAMTLGVMVDAVKYKLYYLSRYGIRYNSFRKYEWAYIRFKALYKTGGLLD